ncbi:hypothetical protein BH20VER1_BH20VER1_09050 [soil metagenome]
MNGELISERHNAQESSTEFGDRRPKAEAIVLLWLAPKRLLNDTNAHLFREIWPACEDIILEVVREPEICHTRNVPWLASLHKVLSRLTRHKISCREPSVHATQHTLPQGTWIRDVQPLYC